MTSNLSDTLRAELDSGALEGIKTNQTRQTRWTVAELYDAELPETHWVVPGHMPIGLGILGGRPKLGKSWLMLQTASAKGTGGKLFDQDVTRGAVLYLALEDSSRRLQERIRNMNIPRDALITLVREWKPLHKGGLDDLLIEIEGNDYSLVVIDTLTRALPGVDQNEAETIGPIMARLQAMAMNRDMGIYAVDHTRKPNGMYSDPIDDIMASTAKTAVADVVLALYKERGKKGANLRGRGRDIEEIDLRMFWDPLTYSWQSMGSNAEFEMTEQYGKILAILDDLGRANASEIAKAAGEDYGNTYKRLQQLANSGQIRRDGKHYERLHI